MIEVESFKHNGRKVTIYPDEHAESPRVFDCNLATLACWHRRVNLGDEQTSGETETELCERVAASGEEILALLPLYLYQHGDMTIRTTPFGDRWDSGQVGWAYVTKASAEKLGCMGAGWERERYLRAIVSEVETYDMFLRGAVYGYVVEGAEGDELDSCWGFYGLDDARGEGKAAAESSDDPATDRAAAELESRPTFAGNRIES